MYTYRIQLMNGEIPDNTGPFWYWAGVDEYRALRDISQHFRRDVSDFCIVEKTYFLVIHDGKLNKRSIVDGT